MLRTTTLRIIFVFIRLCEANHVQTEDSILEEGGDILAEYIFKNYAPIVYNFRHV